MFRDEIVLELKAGRGGDGLLSFRHERGAPKGGPDGGDGGRGGNIVLRARDDVNSLLRLGRRKGYVGGKGQPGGVQNMTGRDGADLVLDVPRGTQVFDSERGNLLRDLASPGMELVVCKGGTGGRGNTHFTNAVRQAPRIATKGRDGEVRVVRLEQKIWAEIGLIGLPNAGKSTFLARVTAATPKIASYPFTTLVPQVGIATVGDYDTLCIADLPGLIAGASEGHGLGHRFLKHVERCSALMQLVDVSDGADLEPEESWRVIDQELANSSPDLHAKPRITVASKCEDEQAEARAKDLEQALGTPVLRMSAATGAGLEQVLEAARELVRPTERW